MNVSKSGISQGRAFPFVLGGCAVMALCVLPLCIVLGGIANAGYWIIRQPPAALAQGPSTPTDPAEYESLPVGEARAGEQLFTSTGCSACHSLEPGVRVVGPSLSGVADRAEGYASDYTAEMYLYESIVHPNAYVVVGFHGSIMPAEYGNRLSSQELADLVAFLMTK